MNGKNCFDIKTKRRFPKTEKTVAKGTSTTKDLELKEEQVFPIINENKTC